MAWTIGNWQEFKEGEIHQVLRRSIKLLEDNGFSLKVDFITEKKKLPSQKPEGGLFEILKEYEQEKGVGVLLEVLIRGLVILKAKKNDLLINLQLFLRSPQDSEKNIELFKEIIANWVKEDKLTFTERFFRLPKITEDLADRYLDNPLEQVLRKTFGFHFKYKLTISSLVDSPESQKLREALYKIIAYS